jgi:hypothetical protein
MAGTSAALEKQRLSSRPLARALLLLICCRCCRSNGYRNDALSHGSPWAAICARGDLDPGHPSPGGCYDGKVSCALPAAGAAATALCCPLMLEAVMWYTLRL